MASDPRREIASGGGFCGGCPMLVAPRSTAMDATVLEVEPELMI